MEEWVGKVWHRFITGMASREHAASAVGLEQVRTQVTIMFRALGGDGGLKIDVATPTAHGARRRWLERVAGIGTEVELAWRDEQTLRLPVKIALFAERALNRELYLWLAALAAVADEHTYSSDWLRDNQRNVQRVLQRYPGLKPLYQRLVEAHLAQRPAPDSLSASEQARETALRQALSQPGSVIMPVSSVITAYPVHLWLNPAPPNSAVCARATDDADQQDDESRESRDASQRKHRAKHEEMPDGRDGLLAIRFENMMGQAEYVKVDRTTEDDELDTAAEAANTIDDMALARDARPMAGHLRLDLDLPSAEYDDIMLGEGIPLPEWHWRKQQMQPDYVRLQPMMARNVSAQPMPEHLLPTAKRLRRQFAALAHSRHWLRGQPDGCELDLDAWFDYQSERRSGGQIDTPGLYRDLRVSQRDMACLLLADLSLSTDAYVNNHARVIDVIRDSLQLFSEALTASGDMHAIYGFSSRKRSHVRFHILKDFDERTTDQVRGRIQAIKPGYYTRMGAAIRHASDLLVRQPARRQLLLILTDGKPNDLDQYEGRYGVEDTRMALIEARKRGLVPFCVTIDKQAGSYLPHIFGAGNFTVLRRPEDLPRQLPGLYARLTG